MEIKQLLNTTLVTEFYQIPVRSFKFTFLNLCDVSISLSIGVKKMTNNEVVR